MMVVRQVVQNGRICQSKELSLGECVPKRRNLGGDVHPPAWTPTGPQQGCCPPHPEKPAGSTAP